MTAHFIDGTEPDAFGVSELALRALELRAGAEALRCDGMRLGAVFFDPSLRTRTSLQAACQALGITPIVLSPGADAWSLEHRDGVVMDGDKTEHVADAVRVLSSWVDLLAVRAFPKLQSVEEDRADPMLSAFTRYSPVPVINLESARWHPLQGLADTSTWMSRLGPDLQGQPITLTWAPHVKSLPGSVPNQVLLSAALQGMEVTVAHPEGFDLDPEVVARASALAEESGGEVRVIHDQAEALRGARVVYAKSWGGFGYYGRRDEEKAARDQLRDWMITTDKMARTDDAGFMHCLPVRRNLVVADAVIDSASSWVYEQAANRLFTAMALLERMVQEDPWSTNT